MTENLLNYTQYQTNELNSVDVRITVCPRSLVNFRMPSRFIKFGKTSWKYAVAHDQFIKKITKISKIAPGEIKLTLVFDLLTGANQCFGCSHGTYI